jgi:hypothetical protein
MKRTPVKNLNTLEKEIYRLKMRSKEIEKSLDGNIESLRENYGSMAMNSFFGQKKSSSSNFWASLTARILESEKLQNSFSKLAESLADKIGEGISHAADKIFHKKEG